jgi:beta-lactamase superfamily II metal-dependent hydrolase
MAFRAAAAACFLAVFTFSAAAAHELDIYFIDVEGGQSTLVLTPAGESLLIDTGYAMRGQRGAPPLPAGATTGRDAQRILDTMREAGIDHIDYLLITHIHSDHAGAVPELAARVPIGTFIDYGDPLGTDRLTNASFRAYQPVRAAAAKHLVPQPGDRLPLKGLETEVVSAGGTLISKPVGDGPTNTACVNVEDQPEDGTENYRSIGVLFKYGAFRFLDLGDLSGNTLTRLACPRNMIGHVSAYLIAHHGDYDTSVPALYAALAPRVAIMDNGPIRGGDPAAFAVARSEPAVEDLWQLHTGRRDGVVNAPDDFIANVDDGTQTAFNLKLTASDDGSFRLTNPRTGFTKVYPKRKN